MTVTSSTVPVRPKRCTASAKRSEYKSLNAVSWLLGLGAVAFLWVPAPASTFFAKRPRPIDGAA